MTGLATGWDHYSLAYIKSHLAAAIWRKRRHIINHGPGPTSRRALLHKRSSLVYKRQTISHIHCHRWNFWLFLWIFRIVQNMQSRVVLAAASGRKAAAAGESINGKPIVTQKSALPHPCNACHKHERQSRNICVLTCFLYMSNAGHFTSSAKAKKVWNSRLLYLVICWFLPKVKIESHDLREFVWTNSLRQIQFLIHFQYFF
mgnify:CR=1 FL=1